MKVFSKEKYLKRCRELGIEPSKLTWPDRCDGMPVMGERCISCDGVSYGMCDTWCIDVPDPKVSDILDIVKEEKKMYTMKDFINKPIAVRVGQDHKIEFLKMCEAEGLKWMSGQKAADHTPPEAYGDDMCIACDVEHYRKGLGFAETRAYQRHGMTIVDFKDIKPNEPRYQIIIDCDGKTTTAKMLVDGKEVKTGVAKYNPADKFDFSIGAKVAFDRLWGKEVTKPEPVKFKVGDRVKCVTVPDGNKEAVGKCGTVKKVCDGARLPILVDFDERLKRGHDGLLDAKCKSNCGWWCDLDNLELAKDEPFPFKVGDRVKCTKMVDGNDDIIGKYGTVIHLKHDTRIPVTVEFDAVIFPGHNGLERVKGKVHHCWCCPVDALELVTVREVKRPAKPGEYIKIVAGANTDHDEYKIGDILKVVKVDDDLLPGADEPHVAFYKAELRKYANYNEYVVLEGYVPPVEPDEFKIGDRVVCTDSVGFNARVKGSHGTVRMIEDGWCHVEFDKNVGGHDLGGRCKDGYGLLCPFKKLKVKQYKEVKRHAKVGEWVKIVDAKGNTSERYKNGDIKQVTADAFGCGVRFACGGCHCVDSEYVVLEGYKE